VTAHCLQILTGPEGFERLAQTPDMNIDRPFLEIRIGAPHVVQYLGPAERAALMGHEKFQEAVLRRPHGNFLAVLQYPTGNRVFSSAALQRRRTARMRAISSRGENGFTT
jgi:hypothetical protein